MGISGLLPALKAIQVTKHLSEFNGQTLAVDAYVWLHRGVFTCATELATGKDTHKYVNYAMQRVRLLRHHNIEPYLVFDGGPLPAKRGTENERKQKRDENLARGNSLASQGKHKEAREYYLKCVDVTPQMAYQLIKALRAENVSFIVAPYEADAQLAYLERTGLVDGIITEDSDLLVFGCRKVLFKLDSVANTVVSISRDDFSSVSDGTGISLVGWSDVQFRSMAILSGCDYLPSISGVGLKTACTLLRKWKTVEQVVRAITLEGKKSVPNGYLKQFRLAENCFLHQRVYSPIEERLVHLTDIDGDWTEEAEAYVGGDIDAALAKKIAQGDVDPVTLLPMNDINPRFMPRVLKPIPFIENTPTGKNKGKEKAKAYDKGSAGGILSFFGPNPVIPPQVKTTHGIIIRAKQPVAGKASGKRTLADVMDQDVAHKKEKYRRSLPPLTQSKFFGTGHRRRSDNYLPVASSSHLKSEKENIIVIDDDGLSEPDASDTSMEARGVVDAEMEMDLEEPLEDAVEQEDGYISPSPLSARNTEELSSPPRPGFTPARKRVKREHFVESEDDVEFGAEALSSPMSAIKLGRSRSQRSTTPTKGNEQGFILVSDTPMRDKKDDGFLASPSVYPGPDLRDVFDLTSDIDIFEDDRNTIIDAEPPGPDGGQLRHQNLVIDVDEYEISDTEEQQKVANALRSRAVMDGWRDRWALNGQTESGKSDPPTLKRSETNVTPAGRHSLGRLTRSAFIKCTGRNNNTNTNTNKPTKTPSQLNFPKPRRSLLVFESLDHQITKSVKNPDVDRDVEEVVDANASASSADDESDLEDAILPRPQLHFTQFRCS